MDPMEKYILALDEGTSSAKAFIVNKKGRIVGKGQDVFSQFFPKPGWVEQDPMEIWSAQKNAITVALDDAGITIGQIASIGITNQRETTVVWDKQTGKPVFNAIVWQDRRTASRLHDLDEEIKLMIKKKTGLIPDAYFSGSKIKWILDNVSDVRKKAEQGELCFGTIDSFLIYHLTGGSVHATDVSNASRTMIFDIHRLQWDNELVELFDIPRNVLPDVKESSEIYGYTDDSFLKKDIPISGCAGDQQAALFGQVCFKPGMVKNTYGTGNFILMNTGEKPVFSNNLLTTLAWKLNGKVEYALEGSVFITGAGVQWLQSLDLIKDVETIDSLASSVKSTQGVYFVPAFVGLGAPYWDPYARGIIIGITQGTNREILSRAVLESTGYLSQDVLIEMQKDADISIPEIRVDGGGVNNRFLMQFQADISGHNVIIPSVSETTALGAAFLAGLSIGYWEDQKQLEQLWTVEKTFTPNIKEENRRTLYAGWKKAVARSQGWISDLKHDDFETAE